MSKWMDYGYLINAKSPVIDLLDPHKIVSIQTMHPDAFLSFQIGLVLHQWAYYHRV